MPDLTPEPGSSLAGDDRATNPFQLSHGIAFAIAVANDYLGGVVDLVVEDDGSSNVAVGTRPYALYGLLRASFENAATAVWLLCPRQRSERIRRRFQQVLADAKNSDKALTAIGKPETQHAQRLRRVTDLADKAGISIPKRWPGYHEIVRSAGESFDLGGGTAEMVWRALSGAAHGDSWAVLTLVTHEIVRTSADGVHDTIQTTDVSQVAALARMVVRMIDHATHLYELRRTSFVNVNGN